MRTFIALFCLLCFGSSFLRAQIAEYPFIQSFDGGSSLPAGWSTIGFSVSGTSPASPPFCLSSTGNLTLKWVQTPGFSFRNHRPLQLRFRERRSSTALSYRLTLSAIFGTNRLALAEFDSSTSTSSYIQRIVILDSTGLFGSDSVSFRWEIAGDNSSSTGVLRIDDVMLTAASATDLSLASLSALPVHARNLDPIMVQAQVLNSGFRSLGGFSVGFYRSQDRAALFSASVCESAITDTIFPNGTVDVSADLGLFMPGNWWIGCRVTHPEDGIASNDTLSAALVVGNGFNDVVITEVQFAPANEEPEWIEIYNPGTQAIDLRGWTVSDNSLTIRTSISSTGALIAPESYAVIARDESVLSFHPEIRVPLYIVPFSALNNSTPDAVVLRDAAGNVIDSLMYDPSRWSSEGRSLERIDVFASSANPSNWTLSADSLRSTPGRRNSVARLDRDLELRSAQFFSAMRQLVCTIVNVGRMPTDSIALLVHSLPSSAPIDSIASYPVGNLSPLDSVNFSISFDSLGTGRTFLFVRIVSNGDERTSNDTLTVAVDQRYPPHSLIANEIMFDPSEGNCEWIELLNPNAVAVSLEGWTISDAPTASGSSTTTVLQGTVAPNGFLIVAGDSSMIRWFAPSAAPSPMIFRNSSSGMGLNNEEDLVLVRDLTGATIDSVRYSGRWHHPDLSSTSGRSIERIHPALDSNDPRNWTTSVNALGGTPGTPNSVRTSFTPPPSGTVRVEPSPFSPDGDGFEDMTVIQFRFPYPSSFITAKIFDLRGRPIRWLCNFERVGPEGGIVWDGRNDRRERVPLGAYILLLEATSSASEDPLIFKSVIVVAKKL